MGRVPRLDHTQCVKNNADNHYIIQFYLVNFYLGCWAVGISKNSSRTRNSCESMWWNLNPEKVKFNPNDKRHVAYVGMCVKEQVIVFETNEHVR